MGQTVYSKQPTTFQDLLSQQGQQDMPVPQAPQAVQAAPDSTLSDPTLRTLFERLSQPDNQGPAPTVEKKSTAGSIFKILGDALSTYASIQGRMPLETHSFQKYLDYLDKQKQDLQAFNEKKANAEQSAKLRGAEFLYTADERRKMRADEQTGREAIKNLDLVAREADRKQRADEAAAQRAAQDAKDQRDHAWDVAMEKTRFAHEQTVAGIRKKASEGDEIAKDDKKAMGPILGAITALSLTAKKNLAEGKTTPEELNGLVSQLIDGAMLSPEAQKAVKDHYNLKLGPALRDFHVEQQNKDLAAGSPDASMAGSSESILQRMGSVNAPQRY